MNVQNVQKAAPFLWMGAGVLFLIAAARGRQVAFAGVGVMFILLGFVGLAQARKANKS